jgi:hypothetical protein
MKRHLTTFTNSEQQCARDCMVKHGFAYAEGLRPKVTPRALSFGTAFHAGPAALYRTIGTVPQDAALDVGMADGLTAIDASFKEWLDKVEPLTTQEQLDELYDYAKEAVADARWMFKHYCHTFRADITRLVPLAVERSFSVPMRNVLGRVVPHFRYAGVWDLVAFDPEHGDIVIFDHKTTKGDVGSIDRRVEIDTQMAGYLYALREMLISHPGAFVTKQSSHPFWPDAMDLLKACTGALPIGRIAYNVVRKKRPTAPQINQDGTVSIKAIDTLPEIYEDALEQQREPEWLTKAYANRESKGGELKFNEQATRYTELQVKQADVLQRLRDRGDTFIGRREFFRTPDEIERWRREAMTQANIIRIAEQNDKRDERGNLYRSTRYRNPGHCTGPASLPCSYRSLCIDDAPELRAAFDVVPRHVEVELANRDTEED